MELGTLKRFMLNFEILAQLEGQLSRADFNTWVIAMKPLGLREGILVIRIANSMGQAWLESHVKSRLEDGLGIKIRIEV